MVVAAVLGLSGVALASGDGDDCSVKDVASARRALRRSGFTIAAGVAQPKAIVEVIDFNGDGTSSVPGATLQRERRDCTLPPQRLWRLYGRDWVRVDPITFARPGPDL